MSTTSYLSTPEAAQRFDVTTKTITRWIQAGEFPNAYRLSSAKKSPYRIPLADIEAYEDRRVVIPKDKK